MSLGVKRFEADDSGQTRLVVFADCFDEVRRSLTAFGVRILYSYPFMGAYGVTAWLHNAEKLATIQSVKAVVKESRVSALLDGAREMVFSSYAPQPLSNQLAVKNKKPLIAIMDTGISAHLDMSVPTNRLAYFKDFIQDQKTPYDDNGHGTFVTGVACGNGLLSGGRLKGFAPNARFVSLKCLDAKGASGAFKILNAMQWLYDNHRKYNIKVVCMSFGSQPVENDPLVLGAEILWREGLCIVTAAGNGGPKENTITSPGIAPSVITVGGVDREGVVAEFSSRGPSPLGFLKPDLVAPSVDISAPKLLGGYTKMSGTSFSAPMVAGICALMLVNNPEFTNDRIKSELLKSAKPVETSDTNAYGFGIAHYPKDISDEKNS